MSEIEGYSTGEFCWTELVATGVACVLPFYARLFGWTYRKMVINGETYAMCMKGERFIAAIRDVPFDAPEVERRPFWRSYVSVDGCDFVTKAAEALGADVVSAPAELGELARISVLRDPSGGLFALWQARGHSGSGRANEPGTTCWNELATLDFSSARRFYTTLFGWTCSTGRLGARQYLQFSLNGAQVAAMVALSPRAAHIESLWLVYFAVSNCDDAAELVVREGGRVTVPPIDVPGVGRFCAVRDPAGTLLALIQQSTG